MKTSYPLITAFNWLLVILLFPGLALLFPASRRTGSIITGLLVILTSMTLGVFFFHSFHYYWDYSSHLYAWLFSVLWLAALKANPQLSGIPHLQLEPSENVGDEIILPPAENALSSDLPETDTSVFVTKALTAIDDSDGKRPLTLSGTIIEQNVENIKGKPRVLVASSLVIEKVRELAGGKIISSLGTGGMADVYLVWNPRLELYRAVKVLKPNQTENFMTRFETEIRIFSKLDHPNIVQCYSVGEWHSLPYLEMEYVNGASIDEVLRRCRLLSVEQSLAIGILVSKALHYAHNQVITIYGKTYKGIVHRDLKPANIMLNRNGRIKLMDFGIARPGSVSLHTIQLGSVVGTLPYLAPEQLAGEDLTARTDVYALGATLYEFITGERTFPQTEVPALISAKNRGDYKPLGSSVRISADAASVIDKALSVDPAKRYSSAHTFGLDLEKALFQMAGQDGFSHLAMLIKKIWNG